MNRTPSRKKYFQMVGVSSIQDPFMKKAQAKLLNSRSWPSEFSDKVDMTRISFEAIRPWIESRITQILGDEDEIVYEYCIAQLEAFDPVDKTVDPRLIQINLEGFLGMEGAGVFTWELWNLLLSAQLNPVGVPQQLIDHPLITNASTLKAELTAKQEVKQEVPSEIKQEHKEQEERRDDRRDRRGSSRAEKDSRREGDSRRDRDNGRDEDSRRGNRRDGDVRKRSRDRRDDIRERRDRGDERRDRRDDRRRSEDRRDDRRTRAEREGRKR